MSSCHLDPGEEAALEASPTTVTTPTRNTCLLPYLHARLNVPECQTAAQEPSCRELEGSPPHVTPRLQLTCHVIPLEKAPYPTPMHALQPSHLNHHPLYSALPADAQRCDPTAVIGCHHDARRLALDYLLINFIFFPRKVVVMQQVPGVLAPCLMSQRRHHTPCARASEPHACTCEADVMPTCLPAPTPAKQAHSFKGRG